MSDIDNLTITLEKLKLVRKNIAEVKRKLKINKMLLEYRKDKDSDDFKFAMKRQLDAEKGIQDVENECTVLETSIKLGLRLLKGEL